MKNTKKMIIDIHVHAYPDDLSVKALGSMEKIFGLKAFCGGSISDLLAAMDRADINTSVLQGVALKPDNVVSINTWLGNVLSERIKCFAAMHPDFEGFEGELERVKSLGFWGVKFQPEFQHFIPDEERMFPFYEKIYELDLAVLFHAGFELSNPGVSHATPETLSRIHKMFPKMKIIAGHFGGFMQWDEVEEYLVGTNVLFDTSCVFGNLDDKDIFRIIRAHGADKILLGSDHPLFSSLEAVEGIKRLGLSGDEESLILGENAMRIFGEK